MSKEEASMKEIFIIEYDDIKEKIKDGDFLAAYLAYQLAPYKIIAEAIGKFINVDGGLTDNDADNIEKIIVAGSKSNAKNMRVKINKDEVVGANIALGKLKTNANIKAVVGKSSTGEYEIDVEYK